MVSRQVFDWERRKRSYRRGSRCLGLSDLVWLVGVSLRASQERGDASQG